jgi:photosystem II stability/assembly factor-like uncharacterized protein
MNRMSSKNMAFDTLRESDPEGPWAQEGNRGDHAVNPEDAEGFRPVMSLEAEEILAFVLATPRHVVEVERDAIHHPRMIRFVARREGQANTSVGTSRRRRHHYRTLGVGMAVAALIAVVLVVVPSSQNGRGPNGGHVAATLQSSSLKWRLTAALIGPQFRLATGNPSSVAGVHCVNQTLCFLTTGSNLDSDQGGAIYQSQDGGHTWRPSTLPPHTSATTLLSCPTSNWCTVGAGLLDSATGDPLAGKPSRVPELLVSTDGGDSWTARLVPLPVAVQQIPAAAQFPAETTQWPGAVDAIRCDAPGSCVTVGQAMDPTRGAGDNSLYFLRTADGGAHWSTVQLPERASELSDQIPMSTGTAVSMDCPTAADCVIVGAFTGRSPTVDVWRSTDAGATWREHQVPGIDYLTAPMSCPDAEHCWLMGGFGSGLELLKSLDGGLTWSPVPLPTDAGVGSTQVGWSSMSCSSATVCWVAGAGIAVTQDAGEHWQEVTLPTSGGLSVGAVLQISCNGQQDCAAVAVPAGTKSITENWGSLILTNTPSP